MARDDAGEGRWSRGEEKLPADASNPRFSPSLTRGLGLLRCFTADRPVLGIADLANSSDLSRSTIYRYVVTLVELGYLEPLGDRRYRLGLRVSDLGLCAVSGTGLRAPARESLRWLQECTGLAVGLAVLDGPQVVYVEWLGGWRNVPGAGLRWCPGTGTRLAAHRTAVGMVLLAHLPEQERVGIARQIVFRRRGRTAGGSRASLLAELPSIAEKDYAISDKDGSPGVSEVAVPVRDGPAVVAALGLSCSSGSCGADLLERHGRILDQGARRISTALGAVTSKV
ncbi:MAG: IclR family transcriptional regulator [Solirubrobacteraceae bacterium]